MRFYWLNEGATNKHMGYYLCLYYIEIIEMMYKM